MMEIKNPKVQILPMDPSSKGIDLKKVLLGQMQCDFGYEID
jgi:hypothetical protein